MFDIDYIDFEDWDLKSQTDLDGIARTKKGFQDAMTCYYNPTMGGTGVTKI